MTELNINDLPAGNAPEPLSFDHFPTRQQAVVWRNWELVPADRLAKVLGTSVEKVMELARGMGLKVPPAVNDRWLERGYITLIRKNWHLLPYDQLMELLDWSAEKMAFTLKEDDFLWHKVGSYKPRCQPVRYEPLTDDQIRRTEALRSTLQKHFNQIDYVEPPFAFVDRFVTAADAIEKPVEKERFDLRVIYPYFAVYGDTLIDPSIDPFPDGLLASLARMGINGVWMQSVLYTLVPWEPAPELSVGYEKRLETLRNLVKRAARYGIGVYLYTNEPRAMPLKFFEKYPQWKGVLSHDGIEAALCTSQPEILDYLRNGMERLFCEVPDLAGVFTITMSENLTNCYSRWRGHECPRCSKRPPAEVIAEVNRAIEEGVHRAQPDAKVIVWSWGWDPAWGHQVVDLLPQNIVLMCTSEEALPYRVDGVDGEIFDYSISQVGPSERSLGMWKHARERGIKTMAKVQLNNTWESSAVPHMPVMDLVERHLNNLSEAGVDDLMVSWTLGGYPSENLALMDQSGETIAKERYGEKAAPLIRKAWTAFSKAFKEFPFEPSMLYTAPQNYGPMNLLYAKPTGYTGTMIGFPYDSLHTWANKYPQDVFEQQFEKLSVGWKEGLKILEQASDEVEAEYRENFSSLQRIATAVYCHFRSCYLQVRFIRMRDGDSPDRKEALLKALDEEITLAKTLHAIVREDSRVGYESSNHYYYTLTDLQEKALNCEHLRENADHWI